MHIKFPTEHSINTFFQKIFNTSAFVNQQLRTSLHILDSTPNKQLNATLTVQHIKQQIVAVLGSSSWILRQPKTKLLDFNGTLIPTAQAIQNRILIAIESRPRWLECNINMITTCTYI